VKSEREMLRNRLFASRSLTFILAGGQGTRLHPLTLNRPKPAVTFGGVYRLIDFTLSNCFNSGMGRINILTQYQCESLHSYVRALTMRCPRPVRGGESMVCLCPESGKRYRGTADAVFQTLPILASTEEEFAVILSGDHVYKMDYGEFIRFHADRNAEVTVAAVEQPRSAACRFGVLEIDSRGYATGFEEKPEHPKPLAANPRSSLVSMGIYVFNKRTLIDILADDAGKITTHDFGKDILPALVRDRRVSVYNFSEFGMPFDSYWRDVGTLDSYYSANMELLTTSFFDDWSWPLRSLGNRLPSEFHEGVSRIPASAVDSMIPASTPIGQGSRVTRSVLSPGTRIERSATIQDSILLQGVRVGAGARIRRAILDENVQVARGAEIGFDSNIDSRHGFLTEGGIVVIPANTRVGRSIQAGIFPQKG
jgi:glucose-1-phosphate adenylyltransferase